MNYKGIKNEGDIITTSKIRNYLFLPGCWRVSKTLTM